MKIIAKAVMPDGTNVQVEDWSEDYSFVNYGSTVAAYPESKQTLSAQFLPNKGGTFRFEMAFDSAENAAEAFEKLTSGERSLHDHVANNRGRCELEACI